MRFNLQQKISLAMGLLAALLGTAIALMAADSREVQQGIQRAFEVDTALSRIADQIAIDTLLCRSFEKDLLLNVAQPRRHEELVRGWADAFAGLDRSITAFADLAETTDDRLQARQWRAQATSYQKAFQNLVQALGTDQARTPEQARQFLLPAEERMRTLTITSVAIAKQKAAAAQQAGADLLVLSENNQRGALLLGLIGLSIAAIWSLLFPRYLVRPVLMLTAAAQRIAAGDLSARTPGGGDDELGVLSQSFNVMADTIEQRRAELEEQYGISEAARHDAEEARQAIKAQLATIAQQREAFRQLSVPVLPISDQTLVMPLIGSLDTERLHDLQDEALAALERFRARELILDITGVPLVDTQVARGIISVAQATRLLGASITLVGVRPEVAQTIVNLGIDLSHIRTLSTLQQGLRRGEMLQ